MDALEREIWKSAGNPVLVEEVLIIILEGGGAGVTTNSRHWGILAWGVDLESDMGPVGFSRVFGWSLGFGATDWNAWIGRASKNS